MPKMRVAVIGAGVSGLCALKEAIEAGFDAVCFEKNSVVGGLWHYTEYESHSSIMKSTTINTSKDMMSYSDFPIPPEYSMYMHNTQVLEYLNLYMHKFDLQKRIRFDSNVINVARCEDFVFSGQWNVDWCRTGKEILSTKTEVFDAVMVCTGHHYKKRLPLLRGMSKFKGRQMHSKSYKEPSGFENKKVVIVGIGNSGGDIAVELSRFMNEVYLSTRRGTWVMPRFLPFGKPSDQLLNTRLSVYGLPNLVKNKLMQFVCDLNMDHTCYGLKPDYPWLAQHPMVNDSFRNQLATGQIRLKPDIKELTESDVVFTDGTVVQDVDAIIYCTGYEITFPMLEKGALIDTTENRFDMYKYIFCPELEHHTLAVIGVVQPLGALMPIAELQSRVAAQVFKGTVDLPDKDAMLRWVSERKLAMQTRYYNSARHTVQVDYVHYCDELADMIGCRPMITKLFLSDPCLAIRCLTGPAYPQQYRLRGPNPWSGAREFIMTAGRRVFFPITGKVDRHRELDQRWLTLILLLLILVAFGIFLVNLVETSGI